MVNSYCHAELGSASTQRDSETSSEWQKVYVMINLFQHLLTKLSHGLEMSNDISVSKTRVKITKCESFGF